MPLSTWFVARRKQRCRYWYDFGDDWMHDVVLEATEELPETFLRRLLDGEGVFPPEDCGGIPGYEQCVSVARRRARGPLDQEEQELADWLGDWDPSAFDLHATRRRFDAVAVQDPRGSRAPPAPESGTDFRRFLNQDGDVSTHYGANAGLGFHLSRMVMAATLHPAGAAVVTALRCIRRPARRYCKGRMIVCRASDCRRVTRRIPWPSRAPRSKGCRSRRASAMCC